MVSAIDRIELLGLIEDEDAQLVDVLPEREYAEAHIPGATNIPLRSLTSQTVSALRRDKPVVVY
jgi:rhodanese-related sulfurtransferase